MTDRDASIPPDGANALHTRERALARLAEIRRSEQPEECQISISDPWAGSLLLALLHDWKLEPYRYARQRPTTVMVLVPPTFAREVLMPELDRLTAIAGERLKRTTRALLAEILPEMASVPLTIAIRKPPADPRR